MKHYLDLIPLSARIHRRQTRMTRLCILLAVFLVTGIFGMADMEIKTQRRQAEMSDGTWHAAFRNIDDTQMALIRERAEVRTAAWYDAKNYQLDMGYRIDGVETGICGFEKEFLEMQPGTRIAEGDFPERADSAMVTQNMTERMGLGIGDSFYLETPKGERKSYTISGIFENMPMLVEKDAYAIFLNKEAFTSLFSPKEGENGIGQLFIQFDPRCNIQKTLADIETQFGLADEQTAQNTKLLGLMLQSRDPYMLMLYMTAAALAVLVSAAGIFMIAGSINSSVAQRTEFFGMLRCLGATPKQVKRFVRREALNWCKLAIPGGSILGSAVIWALCGVLRLLSPGLFEGMPVFGVSWIGIIAGIVIGLLTVLLAALAPAAKAAKASPLAAVSGNAGTVHAAKRAANTRFFRMQTALGVHHACGGKNFILMTCSFALCIILFLSFGTIVDFMNHAITPLQPYTPDIRIESANGVSLSPELAAQIRENPGVARVYGRSVAAQIPAQIDGQQMNINLVSYDENQLSWAKHMLASGSSDGVEAGTGVYTVYNAGESLRAGSNITMKTGTGEYTFPIAGVLKNSPVRPEAGMETVVCPEELFFKMTGDRNYSAIDIKLKRTASEKDVEEIRALAGEGAGFSDRRLSNSEAKGAYYSMALFVYGFLAVIAMISVFHIINSVMMSVSTRMKQYGAMRAIGMGTGQLIKMVAAEAVTYAASGIVVGIAAGLPLQKKLFEMMITFRWGTSWQLQGHQLVLILFFVAVSVAIAVYRPAVRLRGMSAVDTIHAE